MWVISSKQIGFWNSPLLKKGGDEATTMLQKFLISGLAGKQSVMNCKGPIFGFCNQTKSTPANIDDPTNNL